MVETDREPIDFEGEDEDLEESDLDIDDEFDSEHLVEDEDELEGDAEDEDEGDAEDEDEDEPALEEDESGSASLDELLAQRAAARWGTEDSEEDDIMSLTPEGDDQIDEALVTRVLPIKQRQEFVCNRCRLVKSKSQLADPQRGLCRDCV